MSSKVAVCQECGRTTAVDSESMLWWIYADRVDGFGKVVRCPQHITVWTLRMAGLGKGKDVVEWAVKAKEQDTTYNPSRIYMADPYPMEKE